MSVEKYIHTHETYREAGEHSHVSMASHRRRLEEAISKLVVWKKELAPDVYPDIYPADIPQEMTLWQDKDFK